MRRAIFTLTATAVAVLLLAGPVAARGRPRVPSVPALVEVTMTGALATTCDDGDAIETAMVMERSGEELFAVNRARLELDIPGVDSSRPYSLSGITSIGFTGCHGERVDGSVSPYGGLGIMLDETGAVTDLLWHFDYHLEYLDGRKRPRLEVMEHFTLSGHDLDFDAETSTVSGFFDVLYHLESPEGSVGYEPVEGSPVFLEFTLTVVPHD